MGLAELQGAVTTLSGSLSSIGNIFKSIGKSIGKFIARMKEGAKKLKDNFTEAKDKISEKFTNLIENIGKGWDGFKSRVGSFGDFVSVIWSLIKEKWDEKVVTPLSNTWEGIKGAASAFYFFLSDTIWGGIKEKWNEKVTTPISEAWDALKLKVSEFGQWASETWQNIRNQFNMRVTVPLGEAWDWIKGKVSELGNSIATYLQPAILAFQIVVDAIAEKFDAIAGAAGGIKDSVGGFLGGLKDKASGVISGSGGGIASGPSSGYPAILHGTEAIVPLGGGRSIPVEMKGGGGGVNMTFNLSGLTDRTDKRQLAREIGNMIQQEMARSIGGTNMRSRY